MSFVNCRARCAVRGASWAVAVLLAGQAWPVVAAPQTVALGTRVGTPASDYRGLGRRDPFAPLVEATPAAPKPGAPAVRRAPGLAGMSVADVVLKGIIASGPTRLALLEGPDGKSYLARAQDRLQDGLVRSIEADAVVLVITGPARGGSREIRKALRPAADGGGQ